MTIRRLTAGQTQRLRDALGINVLDIGSEPYIQHMRIVDVIANNLSSDSNPVANCSTSVTAVGSVVLTLDSMAGMTQGESVVLDADPEFIERVTIKATSGSTITVNCQRLHTPTFPVEVESGLTRVLLKLAELAQIERRLDQSLIRAGVSDAGQAKLYGGRDDVFSRLRAEKRAKRMELASIVNFIPLDLRGGGGGMSLG